MHDAGHLGPPIGIGGDRRGRRHRLVAIVGAIVAKQFSKVPENLMKMSVGVLLVTYGTFWSGEGLRVRWPGGDTWLLFLVVLYAAATWVAVTFGPTHPGILRRSAGMSEHRRFVVRLIKGFGRFWWDFFVGDTPELFVAALVVIGVTALLSETAGANTAAIIVLPILVVVALAVTLYRAQRSARRG